MDEFERAARENLECHIGDVCDPDDDIAVIRDEAWVLAHDGAVDAGADHETAGRIANKVTKEIYG